MESRLDELIPVTKSLPSEPVVRYLAQDLMVKRGFNPIDRMISLAEKLETKDEELGEPISAEMRFKIYSTLAKFYAPQPKSIDVNVQSNENRTITVVSYNDLYNERQAAIQASKPSHMLIGTVEDVVEAEIVD